MLTPNEFNVHFALRFRRTDSVFKSLSSVFSHGEGGPDRPQALCFIIHDMFKSLPSHSRVLPQIVGTKLEADNCTRCLIGKTVII